MKYKITRTVNETLLSIYFEAESIDKADKICQKIIDEKYPTKKCSFEKVAMTGATKGNKYFYIIHITESASKTQSTEEI